MTVLVKIPFRMMFIHRENDKVFDCKDCNFEILTKLPCFKILLLFDCKTVSKNSFHEKCGSSLYHSIYTMFLLIY